MKFCTKCGTQMEDDVNFCPKCGTATNSANQVVNVESKTEVSEKDSSSIVAKLKELHSYFSEIGNAYNIFDNGIGIINDAEWRKTVNKKYKGSIISFCAKSKNGTNHKLKFGFVLFLNILLRFFTTCVECPFDLRLNVQNS